MTKEKMTRKVRRRRLSFEAVIGIVLGLGSVALACMILASAGAADQSPPVGAPSILVVTLDDVGTDQLRSYNPAAPACTEFFDTLATAGVRFTRGYSNPVCSPTRAAWLTGRYGLHSGIGNAVLRGHSVNGAGLPYSALTLPEHLGANGFSTWAVGKWHLAGTGQGDDNANLHGFDHYRGSLPGAPGKGLSPPGGYFDWERTVDGVTTRETRYTTTVMARDAIELMHAASGPWFGMVHFNSAHFPYHAPPIGTCVSCPGSFCPPPGGVGNKYFPAMIQSADYFTKLIVEEAIRATQGNLIVILWGDNGTPTQVPANAPCPRSGKGLLYEGGVNVPVIVAGVGIPAGQVSDALVSPTDLFATVCDLVNLPVPQEAEDSVSAAISLLGLPGLRDHVYLEWFKQNGVTVPGPFLEHRRVVIENRYKLIRRWDSGGLLPLEEMFDLSVDPCESVDLLLSPLSTEGQAAYDRLEDRLHALGAG